MDPLKIIIVWLSSESKLICAEPLERVKIGSKFAFSSRAKHNKKNYYTSLYLLDLLISVYFSSESKLILAEPLERVTLGSKFAFSLRAKHTKKSCYATLYLNLVYFIIPIYPPTRE